MLYPYNHLKIIGAIGTHRKFDSLLDRLLIGKTLFSDKNEVGFDSFEDDLQIAPLMLPKGSGGVEVKEGYETTTLSPAYTKPKMSICYQELTARARGTAINSQVPTHVRYAQVLQENARILEGRIMRLKAYMLSQLIKTGKVDITSPLYGNYLLDFQRDAANTVILAGAARWTVSGVSPMDSLEEKLDTLKRPARAIIFGSAAWALYRRDPLFKDMISKRYSDGRLSGNHSLEDGPIQYEDKLWRYVGHHDSLGVDLYKDSSYVTVSGSDVPLIDPYEVQIIPQADLGVWGYGAIQDVKAEFKAFDIFFKTYELNDPGIPFLQAQSAPVPFHMDINSTMSLTVHS